MDEISSRLGELSAQVQGVNARLTDHIEAEEAFQKDIRDAIEEINKLLSEATGARKVLVWLLGIVIAAAALAKGWVFGGK